jgi:hypothetical protein
MPSFGSRLDNLRKPYLLSTFSTFCRETRIVPDWQRQPHQEMCDELERCIPDLSGQLPTSREVFLAPRYSYKTSLIIALCVYCILKFPDIRIALGRATHEDAMTTLFAVKQVFLMNKIIREVWGDVPDKALVWSERAITVGNRTRPMTEPTIDTLGLGASLTGFHPDLIILDDLVNDLNYRSEATSRRCRELMVAANPILPPFGGSIILMGTRWVPNDVYGWQMMQDAELPEDERQWKVYKRSVYLDDGSLFFPAKLNETFLTQQRRALRNDMMKFSSWYFNEPFEEGTKLFPAAYLRFEPMKMWRFPNTYISLDNGDVIPVRVTMTVDPAPTVGKYSDFTGITVVGCDWEENWWLLWAEQIKKPPSEAGQHILNLTRRFYPEVIGIETGQADPTMVARLQQGLRDIEFQCGIQSYSALQDERKGMRGKEQRIEALQTFFYERRIIINKLAPMRELLYQLDNYAGDGSIDHDDILDALAMQRIFVRPCQLRSPEDLADDLEAREEAASWGPGGPPPPVTKRALSPGSNVGRLSQSLPSRAV